ncbi:TIGR02391 family protein [Streptomyces sp. NBC_00669]|uniref:TIGR02391 family protein n=1 Tax=Streptomyces sp. NBC_00669 TaxID=2976011 RepID=UPI002E32B906|nr:TIGR02391 family protein [Streptomyces sp. NBC_00669]
MITRTVAPEQLPRPTGEDGHVLLDAVWGFFTANRTWPTFDYIDRKLYAGPGQLVFKEVIQQLSPALLRGLHPNIGYMRPQGTHQLSLTIAGAANCTGAGGALSTFLAMVRIASEIEPHWAPPSGEQPMLQFQDLRNVTGIDPRLVTREITFVAAALAVAEPCFRGGGSNKENLDWSLAFDREIRPFAGVVSLQDYWSRRAQVLGADRIDQDTRPYSVRREELHIWQGAAPTPTQPAEGADEPSQNEGSSVLQCVLHPLIAQVAGDRFRSGQYQDAVLGSFRAVEHRVQTLTGSTEVGDRLMGTALGSSTPPIRATRSTGPSLESERMGIRDLFKGAMTGLRNPRAHGPETQDDPAEAQEMLVLASFLMRRLDIEEELRESTE